MTYQIVSGRFFKYIGSVLLFVCFLLLFSFEAHAGGESLVLEYPTKYIGLEDSSNTIYVSKKTNLSSVLEFDINSENIASEVNIREIKFYVSTGGGKKNANILRMIKSAQLDIDGHRFSASDAYMDEFTGGYVTFVFDEEIVMPSKSIVTGNLFLNISSRDSGIILLAQTDVVRMDVQGEDITLEGSVDRNNYISTNKEEVATSVDVTSIKLVEGIPVITGTAENVKSVDVNVKRSAKAGVVYKKNSKVLKGFWKSVFKKRLPAGSYEVSVSTAGTKGKSTASLLTVLVIECTNTKKCTATGEKVMP